MNMNRGRLMLQDAILHEEFEWANIWWDHPDDHRLPRVLLVGDSISVGYCPAVTERLAGKARVDRLSNSRGINDPALLRETIYVLGESPYAAIQFNNGLHGWHIPDEVYATCLRQYLQLLGHYQPHARLIWASSTPVTVADNPALLSEDQTAQIRRRNTLADAIMRDHAIPVNDLFQLVLGRSELRAPDGYHYNAQGQALQAEAVAAALLNVLGEQR
jgi:hypothetical protein